MGNIASQKIADKLINVQELLGVNQGELSELLGYSKSFVSAVANGHLPASRTLVLLLETLEENHRLKQELARSDAEWEPLRRRLAGIVAPYPRHTEAPSTLNETASSTAAEPPKPSAKPSLSDSLKAAASRSKREAAAPTVKVSRQKPAAPSK